MNKSIADFLSEQLFDSIKFDGIEIDNNTKPYSVRVVVPKTLCSSNKKNEKIKDVFVNKEKRVVVVKWYDGSTSKATCQKGDRFSVEAGVAIAIAKKYLGGYDKLEKVIQNAKVLEKKEKK